MTDRPEQERIPGSRPAIPPSFYIGTLGVELDPDRPAAAPPPVIPRCRICGDRLTVTDIGERCRQCRLEGRTA